MKAAHSRSSRKGSAILITILIAVCMSIVVFSIFDFGFFERRMNAREALMAQARYAAESMVENACAQASLQIKLNAVIPNDYFNTKKNPSHLTRPAASAFSSTNVDPTSLELKVGDITPYQVITIPSGSPDSLQGQAVEVRRLTFYGKATARDAAGRSATAYCSETLQVRGQSPATNMAFYNMVMELAPGPVMTATGPFFSNRDIWFAASDTLNICGTVATPGNLMWGRLVEDGLQAWSVNAPAQTGKVCLAASYTAPANPNDEGTYTMADFYRSGKYSDSLKSSTGAWSDQSWKNYENQQFKGMVQTRVDDVAERKFAGITDLNNAHVVIEPPVPNTASGYDKNVELQKFSNKAAIIIRPPVYAGGSVKKTSQGWSKKTVNGVEQAPTKVGGATTTNSTLTATPTNTATVWAYVPDGQQSGTFEGPFTRANADGSLGEYYLMDVTAKVPNLANILTVTSGSSTTATATSDAGFYDGRQGQWMTIYNLDMVELKKAVADTTAGNPLHEKWNGIVYVDSNGYQSSTSSSTADENIKSTTSTSKGTTTVTTTYTSVASTTTSTTGYTGVLLKNGGLGNLPSIPTANKPTASADDGFTLATNDPVYIKGNFNADGSVPTSTPSAVRAADSANETMACIASDAVTILSNNWTNQKSSLLKSDRAASSATEVSAVLMTGLVATSVNSSYSGGVHNFPRFLETWSGKAFGYRGSLLAFWESKRATGKWTLNYYDPPNRIWGWDKRLEGGRLVYGLSRVMTSKRISFSDLDPTTYNTAITGL